VWSLAEEPTRRRAARAGAVGEVGGRLFGSDGAAVATDLDDRVLGVTLDQLRKTPEVIGLMYDARRADAAAAALRGGLVSTFVTDASLARALIEEPPS
jgi:DNA-binding transcriptional regulator LsrR (DeoR family)